MVGSENVDGKGRGVCVGTGAYVNRGGGFWIDGEDDVETVVELGRGLVESTTMSA